MIHQNALSCKICHPMVVMGPDQKFLTRVGSGQPFMVWVWIWKISLKNIKSGQKKSLRVRSKSTRVEGGLAFYLLRVKSKLGSGQVRAHLYPMMLVANNLGLNGLILVKNVFLRIINLVKIQFDKLSIQSKVFTMNRESAILHITFLSQYHVGTTE